MKKQKLPQQLQVWADARQRFHLSDAQVQMARELGLNPYKFGKLANERQEPWKAPLPEFIEHIYFKRFKKTAPDKVLSLEEYAQELERKKEAKRQRKYVGSTNLRPTFCTDIALTSFPLSNMSSVRHDFYSRSRVA